jgi:predicted transglutaminase-like cysteine proteinase
LKNKGIRNLSFRNRLTLNALLGGTSIVTLARKGIPVPRAYLSAYFCLAVALLVAFGAMAPAGAANTPQLFGSDEVRSSDLRYFPKWTDMLERYRHEVPATHWGRFIDGLRGADPLDQLDRINRYMNDVPHKADANNYPSTDYWATPRQFFDRSGDCEDFAIAKFLSLRSLGWDNDQLRIVILDDLARGTPHAVKVAYYGGEAWMLDNQYVRVVRAERIEDYRPRFSINETSWWLHRAYIVDLRPPAFTRHAGFRQTVGGPLPRAEGKAE